MFPSISKIDRTPGGRIPALPRAYLAGLGISNNVADATNDIDFAVGKCRDAADAEDLVLPVALTKQLDVAWAPGSGAGGLDTGAIANGTYHCYVIGRGGRNPACDAIFSASAVAPALPANFTRYRRIASILRESGAIVAFIQYGDFFYRKATVLDVDATNPGDLAVTRTLSVPTGVKMMAIFNGLWDQDGAPNNGTLHFSSLDQNDEAPSRTAAPLYETIVLTASSGFDVGWTSERHVWTNTSAQIRSRCSGNQASSVLRVATIGWMDYRGRND